MSIRSVSSLDTIVSLAKRRGFIFPSSEIYGGFASCYDYGPLGVELKRNVKDAWWRDMVHRREDIVGIDASILMHPKVWEASGHVSNFNDPLVECSETNLRYRFDKLQVLCFKQESGTLCFAFPEGDPDYVSKKLKKQKLDPAMGQTKGLAELSDTSGVVAPDATKPGTLSEPRQFNLMFKTHLGPVADSANIVYLRPETAQGIFVNFQNVVDSTRVKLPFGVAQQGKSFRNEVTTRRFTFRTCEFEQMEMEYFCHPDSGAEYYEYWRNARLEWFKSLGVNPDRLRLRDHASDELAHYSRACADVEYLFPFGWSELEGIAWRGDYDLKQHSDHSSKDLVWKDQSTGEACRPNVVEPALGTDRAILTLLTDAYVEEEVDGNPRTVLKFHPRIAPFKIAVFPLLRKDGHPEKARELYLNLRDHFAATYDDSGNIGRRYRRQDEAGTPFCVTVDHQTLEDNTITLRNRDTLSQDRVLISELRHRIETEMGF